MRIAAVLALVACGGPAKPAVAPTPAGPEQMIGDTLAAFEHGDVTTFDNRLDPDGVFLGVGFQDVWDASGFAAAQKDLLAQAKPGTWHVHSDKLHVSLSPDRKSAWMTATLAWDEGSGAQPIRWTAVLVQRGGRWVIGASHASVGVANAQAAMQAGAGQLPDPSVMPDKVDADAKPIVAMFDADLASNARWLGDISTRDDVLVIGSDPSEVWLGPAEIKKGFDGEATTPATITRNGPVTAHVVGEVAWLAANVRVELTDHSVKPMPLRILAVYLREGGAWKMVQLHASTANLHG